MSLEKLDEERVEKALIRLSSMDKSHAELEGQVKYLAEGIKQAKAHSFLLADGTVAEREAKALSSDKYALAVDAWVDAFKKFKEIIKAQKGNINSLKEARFKHNIISAKNCKIEEMDIKKIKKKLN